MNTAADFLSWLDGDIKAKDILRVREDIQTTSILIEEGRNYIHLETNILTAKLTFRNHILKRRNALKQHTGPTQESGMTTIQQTISREVWDHTKIKTL